MLTAQHKLLAHCLEPLLLELILSFVGVFAHLGVLLLEEVDVHVTGLVIVEESTNARLLLILNNFFFQDFHLELHKVHLLLQIGDVFVCCIISVDVGAEVRLVTLVLTVELHLDSRLVAHCLLNGGVRAGGEFYFSAVDFG
jgi:hypothetical protein